MSSWHKSKPCCFWSVMAFLLCRMSSGSCVPRSEVQLRAWSQLLFVQPWGIQTCTSEWLHVEQESLSGKVAQEWFHNCIYFGGSFWEVSACSGLCVSSQLHQFSFSLLPFHASGSACVGDRDPSPCQTSLNFLIPDIVFPPRSRTQQCRTIPGQRAQE